MQTDHASPHILDCLIIGAGLAGCVLAHSAERRGLRLVVVQAVSAEPTASEVAAGLMNPVTGRRMALTWKAKELFSFLKQFYPAFEQKLQTRFFYPKAIYRPFDSLKTQNEWIAQSAEKYLSDWIRVILPPEKPFGRQVRDDFGGLLLGGGGFVDIPKLTEAYQMHLKAQQKLKTDNFDSAEAFFESGCWHWKGIKTKHIIVCRGAAERFLDFSFLPFSVVKGDILDIKIQENSAFEGILNRNGWFFEHSQQRYKLGSTYEHTDLSSIPRPEAQEKLLGQLRTLWLGKVEVLKHQCALRPATKDRRPFLGLHPQKPNFWLFNGLGSKGSSLAPFFATHLLEAIFDEQQIDKSVDLMRFLNPDNR